MNSEKARLFKKLGSSTVEPVSGSQINYTRKGRMNAKVNLGTIIGRVAIKAEVPISANTDLGITVADSDLLLAIAVT